MTKKGLLWATVTWVILMLICYYMPMYVTFFIWLGFSLVLLIIVIIQLIKLIRERKVIKSIRVVKLTVFTALFLLTLFYGPITSLAIEKIDWLILENKRTEIVRQAINKELNPNVSWNNVLCQLPFEFPVISNSGNDIFIERDIKTGKTTVTFWIMRSSFGASSIYFIYTDDLETMKIFEDKIASDPKDNWKVKENWYRIYGDRYPLVGP